MPSIQDPSLTSQLRSLRFLVLDEADRMVEAGHFQELEHILRLTARPPPDMDTFVFLSPESSRCLSIQLPQWRRRPTRSKHSNRFPLKRHSGRSRVQQLVANFRLLRHYEQGIAARLEAETR
jgi:hypothetical protein